MRIISLLLALSLFHAPEHARAAFMDGNALLQSCEVGREDPNFYQESAKCLFYVVGVTDASNFFQTAEGIDNFLCIPSSATAGQLRDTVVKFLKDNPAERHKEASVIVYLSLAGAYPCGINP